jgi:putative inorganic carbon (HCO3(-)) transporter
MKDEMGDRFDGKLLVLVAVAIPLSVKVYAWRIGLEVIFPAELLIGAVAGLTVIRVTRAHRHAHGFLRSNPMVLAVAFHMAAVMASAAGSAMPVESLKALVVRMAYITAFFILPVSCADGRRMANRSLLAHAWVLLPLAFWGAAGQVEGGFDRASAGFVMHPLYQDRTIFSAALGFGAIALLAHGLLQVRPGCGAGSSALHTIAGSLLFIAAVLTFTRSAWLGMSAGAFTAVLMFIARRWRRASVALLVLALGSMVAIGVIGGGHGKANASAHRTGFSGTLRSFTNITTDPTNMERLNRWSCAWRMFFDAPVLGHGPGTFQFVFPPYQREDERTPISPPDAAELERYTDFKAKGHALVLRPGPMELEYSKGTAHSEYLLALSEGGAIGALSWILLVVVGLWQGWRVWWSAHSGGNEALTAMAFLGLVAYAVHAVFNNYLDDCKVAMPFWLSLAVIATARVHPRGSSVA